MDRYVLETRPGQPGFVYATREDGQVFEVYLQYASVEPMREEQSRMTDPTERAALVAACRAYKAPAAPAPAPPDTSRDLPDVSAQMRRAGFETDEGIEPCQVAADATTADGPEPILDATDRAAMATSADWLTQALDATHDYGEAETVTTYRDRDGALSSQATPGAQTVAVCTRRRVTTTYPDGTVAEGWETLSETTAPYAPLPRALAYRDPAYHQGLHDGWESSDAILHACEQLTDVDLLTETYECRFCPITEGSPEDVMGAHAEDSPCRDHLSFFEPAAEPNAAQALWQDDPDGQVEAYLAVHCTAEEGDTLHWGAWRLVYSDGAWA